MRPFEAEIELLEIIPGVARQTAEEVLAEIGTDMEVPDRWSSSLVGGGVPGKQ